MRSVEEKRFREGFPEFRSGDTVRVTIRITEGEKTRLQKFEGVVIARRGKGLSKSFTIRRISYGVGVEKTFPLHSPMWESIEVVKPAIARRAKLSYFSRNPSRDMRLPEDESRVVVAQKTKKSASKTAKVSDSVKKEREQVRKAKKKAKRASRRASTSVQVSKSEQKKPVVAEEKQKSESVPAEEGPESKPAEVKPTEKAAPQAAAKPAEEAIPASEAKPPESGSPAPAEDQPKPEESEAGTTEEKKE